MAGPAVSVGLALAPDETRGWPSTRYAWYVTAILHVAYIFAIIDRIIVGTLAPYLKADLGLTDTELGLIQGIGFAICYTLFGLLFGWATDKWTRRTLAALGIVVWSIATVLCGFAVGFWSLAMARIGVAIGEATLNPAASSLIADLFPRRQRPRAFGVYQMGAAVGSLAAYVLSGFILATLDPDELINLPLFGPLKPWQLTFVVLGLPGVFVGLWLYTIREPKRQGQAATGQSGSWREAWAFIAQNRGPIISLNLGVALVMMSVYGWLFWLATFFLRVHDWPVSKTAIVYGLTGGIIGVFSAWISGPVTDRLARRGHADAALRTCAIGAAGCAIFGALAAIMPNPVLAIATLCVWKLFVNLPTAAALTSLNEFTPNEFRGKVTSIYIMTLGLLGSGSGALVVALLTDHLFADESMIDVSLALVSVVGAGLGALVLFAGLKSFAASRARAVAREGA